MTSLWKKKGLFSKSMVLVNKLLYKIYQRNSYQKHLYNFLKDLLLNFFCKIKKLSNISFVGLPVGVVGVQTVGVDNLYPKTGYGEGSPKRDMYCGQAVDFAYIGVNTVQPIINLKTRVFNIF